MLDFKLNPNCLSDKSLISLDMNRVVQLKIVLKSEKIDIGHSSRQMEKQLISNTY